MRHSTQQVTLGKLSMKYTVTFKTAVHNRDLNEMRDLVATFVVSKGNFGSTSSYARHYVLIEETLANSYFTITSTASRMITIINT